MTLQYLSRRADNKFMLFGAELDNAVLVLTKVFSTNSLIKSSTVLEACVYADVNAASTAPANFAAKFEFIFNKNSAVIREYYPNNTIKTSFTIPSATAELLNFTDGTNDFRFTEYDNNYQIGVKLSDEALAALLTMPSIDGTSTLGSEWELPTV